MAIIEELDPDAIYIEITTPLKVTNVVESDENTLTVEVSDAISNRVKTVTLSDGIFIQYASFVFIQTVPEAVWHIVHPLNKFPSVTIVDSSKRVVIGEVQYLTDTTIDVTFTSEFSGFAYLN